MACRRSSAADDALGPFDIAFTGSKKFVISIGLGGSDEFKAGFGEEGELLATLVTGRLDRPGVSLFADVMAHEITENPDGDDIDSNPTGLLRQRRWLRAHRLRRQRRPRCVAPR